tara:strand:+ start:981 stop:1163 length:183 start_codon:yes stop_codon:yes gene_type:complete
MDDLETHERECALRFKSIEERLERGSARMDRIESSINNLLFAILGVYPFILASIYLARYV